MAKNGEAPKKTCGGCTLEQLCKGTKKDYVCDASCLVELTNGQTANDQVDMLKDKVREIFNIIEHDNNKIIEKFIIGKSYMDKLEDAPMFKAMDPNTWYAHGISCRWSGTYKYKQQPPNAEGTKIPNAEETKIPDYNGLIVLTVVTKEVLPHDKTTGEEYALMLEKRLLYYYKIETYDSRIKNTSFDDGNTCKKGNKHPGFVVYVAVKFNDISELEQKTRDLLI